MYGLMAQWQSACFVNRGLPVRLRLRPFPTLFDNLALIVTFAIKVWGFDPDDDFDVEDFEASDLQAYIYLRKPKK